MMMIIFVIIASFAYVLYPIVESKLRGNVFHYVEHCQDLAHKMFQEIPKKRMIQIIAACTLIMGGFGFWLTRGQGWVQWLFTLSFALLGFYSFKIYMNTMWQKRIETFDEQLVDALTLLSNALNSNLNLSQGIGLITKEMAAPIAQEFGTVMSQEKLGLTLDEALQNLMEKIPSDDLTIAINSILILRETGGDLSETFQTISKTILERRKIQGKISSMTAQGKVQGMILIALPFFLLAAMYYMNPTYVLPLIKTELGWIFLFIMLVLQAIGGLWMRKIIKIDV
jgi:tight adherence protein B